MTLPHGLLLDVQRRLETLYALEPRAPVSDFVISQEDAARYPGGGSRTLVRQEDEVISVGVVFDDEVARRMREADPRVRLDSYNLGALATLTEEVSHFLYLLFCAETERSVTELELELQGEVDKYLTATALLALQSEAVVARGLRPALFRRYHLVDGLTPERVRRYHEATQLADRYCGWLEACFLRARRFADLAREARRFYRLGQREKLARIERM